MSASSYLLDLGLQVAQLQGLFQASVRVLCVQIHLLLLLMEELQQLLDLRGQVHVFFPRQLDPCTHSSHFRTNSSCFFRLSS